MPDLFTNPAPTAAGSPQQSQPPIRLLALDLDGTTVGASNRINPAVKQAIQAAQAQGVQVAIATGRMFRSALKFHQELALSLPLMAYQGALIQDPSTAKIHRHLTLPKSAALNLLDYFEQPHLHDQLSVHFYINDQLYVRQLNAESADYAARSGIQATAVGDLRQLLGETDPAPTKVLAISPDPELVDHLLTALRQHYPPNELYFTKSVSTFFEATHPQVNKGTAVQYLAEQILRISPEQVMAIGDNFNDLEMIHYAGVGVAMGNAPEAVKAAANWVAPDVEAQGVAAAIGQFILSGT